MTEHGEVTAESSEHSDHDSAGEKRPKQVTILVNNRPVKLRDDEVTGAQIKAAAGVPDGFKLYDPRGNEVEDEERIRVKEGERFTAISGQDVS